MREPDRWVASIVVNLLVEVWVICKCVDIINSNEMDQIQNTQIKNLLESARVWRECKTNAVHGVRTLCLPLVGQAATD